MHGDLGRFRIFSPLKRNRVTTPGRAVVLPGDGDNVRCGAPRGIIDDLPRQANFSGTLFMVAGPTAASREPYARSPAAR